MNLPPDAAAATTGAYSNLSDLRGQYELALAGCLDLPTDQRPVLERVSVEPASPWFPGVEVLKRIGVTLRGKPLGAVVEADVRDGWVRVPLQGGKIKVSQHGKVPSTKRYGIVQIVWVR